MLTNKTNGKFGAFLVVFIPFGGSKIVIFECLYRQFENSKIRKFVDFDPLSKALGIKGNQFKYCP